MEIWLSKGNSDKLKFPINPESIGKSKSTKYNDITLANGNEKTIKGGKALDSFSFGSYFPSARTSYTEVFNLLAPMEYVNKLEKWVDESAVLLFQVTTTNINTKVTIRSFDWEEKGGQVGDIDFTIELKQYEPVSYSKIQIVDPAAPAPTNRPPSNSTKPSTYVVKSGDSLWKIAKIIYGKGEEWRKIYNKNKSIIGPNPNLIYPGQRLVIP